jgi:hypothetical protein
MIERTYNDKREILDAEFEEIVKNQILKSRKSKVKIQKIQTWRCSSQQMGSLFFHFRFLYPTKVFDMVHLNTVQMEANILRIDLKIWG